MLDATGTALHTNTSILVRGGRIAAVGELPADPNVPTLDAAGASVLPGLIDSHVHLSVVPGATIRKDSPETLRELRLQHLRAYLACGVTTVLDAGSEPEISARAEGGARRRRARAHAALPRTSLHRTRGFRLILGLLSRRPTRCALSSTSCKRSAPWASRWCSKAAGRRSRACPCTARRSAREIVEEGRAPQAPDLRARHLRARLRRGPRSRRARAHAPHRCIAMPSSRRSFLHAHAAQRRLSGLDARGHGRPAHRVRARAARRSAHAAQRSRERARHRARPARGPHSRREPGRLMRPAGSRAPARRAAAAYNFSDGFDPRGRRERQPRARRREPRRHPHRRRHRFRQLRRSSPTCFTVSPPCSSSSSSAAPASPPPRPSPPPPAPPPTCSASPASSAASKSASAPT